MPFAFVDAAGGVREPPAAVSLVCPPLAFVACAVAPDLDSIPAAHLAHYLPRVGRSVRVRHQGLGSPIKLLLFDEGDHLALPRRKRLVQITSQAKVLRQLLRLHGLGLIQRSIQARGEAPEGRHAEALTM